MIYLVDFSKPQWRWMYQPIYQRVVDFALACGDTEEQAKLRMLTLVGGDKTVYLMVKLNETNLSSIIGHWLGVVKPFDSKSNQIFIEQLLCDSGEETGFIKESLDYLESTIAPKHNITRIIMLTDESKYRAFKKKYEFRVQKVGMFREVKLFRDD